MDTQFAVDARDVRLDCLLAHEYGAPNLPVRDARRGQFCDALLRRRQFIRRAVEVGGTISAEHGIGKLKREYLRELYGDGHLREMAALKRAFDPAGILGRGNMFAEEYINSGS